MIVSNDLPKGEEVRGGPALRTHSSVAEPGWVEEEAGCYCDELTVELVYNVITYLRRKDKLSRQKYNKNKSSQYYNRTLPVDPQCEDKCRLLE